MTGMSRRSASAAIGTHCAALSVALVLLAIAGCIEVDPGQSAAKQPEKNKPLQINLAPVSPGMNPAQFLGQDTSYWYLGYAVTDEHEGLVFVDVYRSLLEQGIRPVDDLLVGPGNGTGGAEFIFRLREDLGGVTGPDGRVLSQTRIPVIITRPQYGKASVLFMDGHVEDRSYPGPFPMSPGFIGALESLDAFFTEAPAPR